MRCKKEDESGRAHRMSVLPLGAGNDIVFAQSPCQFLEAVANSQNRHVEVEEGRVGIFRLSSIYDCD